ncbi:hypothetical protein K439DRAFT_1393208 [Ramaria rubella]|nr:hypothetical protein K439DRAFT_1393208 [Ramaria rubella]
MSIADQAWERSFRRGIFAFRDLKYEQAVKHFDEAISKGGERCNVYDSRAAAYEKLDNIKQALRDSRKAIELGPDMRHGYVRSARLFLRLGKYDTASDMIQLGLNRVQSCFPARRLELEEMQQTILEEKEAFLAANAPKIPYFSKLPVELISHIFLCGVEMDIAFPILASIVCSRWRTVALSTPRLWQCISISYMRPAKKMILWSERSKNHITGLRIRSSISKMQLKDTFDVCNPNLSRTLKSLHCELDPLVLSTHLINIPHFNILHFDLHDIQLSLPFRGSSDRTTELRTVVVPLAPLVPLDRASSARCLMVEGYSIDWSKIVPQLSFLRILAIRGATAQPPPVKTLLKLLAANPKLEKVTFDAGIHLPEVEITNIPGIQDRISLPCLTYLELVGVMDARGLVSSLLLNRLEHFTISRSKTLVDEIFHVLQPSAEALTELSILECIFKPERLAPYLQRMSHLTKLEITKTASTMDIIVNAVAGGCRVDGETELYCPLLRHVNFSHCSDLNSGPIVRLVKSRLRNTAEVKPIPPTTPLPASIEAVYINGCAKIDPSVPDWLRIRVPKISCVYMTPSEAKKFRALNRI